MKGDAYDSRGRELREHGTASFPAARYSGDAARDPVALHWHEELEAGIVTRGQVRLCVGRETFTLSQGDGFFVNTGIPHAYLPVAGAPGGMASVVFDPSIVGGQPGSVFWKTLVTPVTAAASMACAVLRGEGWQGEAANAIRSAWDGFGAGDAGCLAVREGLSRLMYALGRHMPAASTSQERRAARDNRRIREMLTYIQAHYDEQITCAQIARSAMISESECLRCFHSAIGITPGQYLRGYRVGKAAQLLAGSDAKVCDIASACGFAEMSYFARAFKQETGMTPSAYRQARRAKIFAENNENPMEKNAAV